MTPVLCYIISHIAFIQVHHLKKKTWWNKIYWAPEFGSIRHEKRVFYPWNKEPHNRLFLVPLVTGDPSLVRNTRRCNDVSNSSRNPSSAVLSACPCVVTFACSCAESLAKAKLRRDVGPSAPHLSCQGSQEWAAWEGFPLGLLVWIMVCWAHISLVEPQHRVPQKYTH